MPLAHPPNFKPPFREDLFVDLTDVKEVDDALLEVYAVMHRGNYVEILEVLLHKSDEGNGQLIELLLSSHSEVDAWIFSQFPRHPKDFSGSIVEKLLPRLSIFFLMSSSSSSQTASNLLKSHYQAVQAFPKLLDALLSARFDASDNEKDIDSDLEDIAFLKRRKPKKKFKKAIKSQAALEPKLFTEAGLSLPMSQEEADHLLISLLNDQFIILQSYLQSIQQPHMAASIKDSFVMKHAVEDSPIFVSETAQPKQEAISNTDTLSAYPIATPLKAALHFESAEGFGEWSILISTAARKHLADARRRDQKFFRIVVKKIKELSNGHFSDDNQKRLTGISTGNGVPIYEAKMTSDSRLVYQVHCVPIDENTERQVLRIFGIYTHAQLDRLALDSLGLQLGKNGKEYRRRCVYRNKPLVSGDNVILPAEFPPPLKSHDEEEDNLVGITIPKDDWDQIHTLLVTEKFIPFSQSVLYSLLADLDATHVFDVTPQEREIIEHIRSCYVIGRSGTGKTTTMLFKMFGIERAAELQKEFSYKPRQVFVTKSRVLAGKVQEAFGKLKQSLQTSGLSKDDLASLAKNKQDKQDDHGLIDLNDDENWRSDLPQKFSLLKDEHFPLFLTFDKLCKLLENDVDSDFMAKTGIVAPPANSPVELQPEASASLLGFSGSFISYDLFYHSYWPHFSQSLTKGLSPILVFNEIMGVIKGSEEACRSKDKYLDRRKYENLSQRAQWTFASQRSTVYSVFEQYMKRKRQESDYDSADRTHFILRMVESGALSSQDIDYLYVDEAQDNLLIDALLLRNLCRNGDGLFWAGDTAQTISVGSAFRFSDLKAFLYRIEEKRLSSTEGVHRQRSEQPKTFQLTTNYRSHGGIVDCAYTVITIISTFWGDSIDMLARERGVVEGTKPVFFSGFDSEKNARYEQFLFNASSGSYIEFGAKQCILVRNDEARRKLRDQVGSDIGLIMTLYESKGLEFDDVLLYNFFEDSAVELPQWRVVLNVLEDSDHGIAAPRFDEVTHAAVCNELKFLYVAITRARKNMWIIDASQKGEPMRTVWTSRNQIQNCSPDTDVPHLAVSSSPEEWGEQGKNLFNHRNFLQAKLCFDRAGLPRESAVCQAYYLRENARGLQKSNSKQLTAQRQNAFQAAAEAFLTCGSNETHTPKQCRAYFRSAGECFREAEDLRRAARAYYDAEEYDSAAQLYRKGGSFDDAVAVARIHGSKMSPVVKESIIAVAKIYYFQKRELQKAVALFDRTEDALEYLEEYELGYERASVLETLGHTMDAAELHLAEGRMEKAVKLFLAEEYNPEALRKGHTCILHALEQEFSFGVSAEVTKNSDTVKNLLSLASKAKESMVDKADQDQAKMFIAINEGNYVALRDLGVRFLKFHKRNQSAILCLDHYFWRFPRLSASSPQEVAETLDVFSSYIILLEQLSRHPNPSKSDDLRRLLSIQRHTDETSLILSGSYLHQELLNSRVLFSTTDDGCILSDDDLSGHFRRSIQARLHQKVMAENDACLNMSAFMSPCIALIATGNCNYHGCRRRHPSASESDEDTYNAVVRIHLQQVLILHMLKGEQITPSQKSWFQRVWLERLYESLHPVHFKMGNLACLRSSVIPEGRSAFQIVKYWCQDVLRDSTTSQNMVLSRLVRLAFISFFFDPNDAPRYMFTANVLSLFRLNASFCIELPDSRSTTIVDELFGSIQDVSTFSISKGIRFVDRVVDHRIPIHINVLCDLIDYLCGHLILARREPHNLTLPRSWFITILKHCGSCRQKDTNSLRILIRIIGQIFVSMQSGNADFLWFEGSIMKLDRFSSTRALFVSRLCRSLALLGYNFPSGSPNQPIIRGEIVRTLQSLRPQHGEPHILYKSYVSDRWPDIAKALQRSTMGSFLDEMITLHHTSRGPLPSNSIRGIQRLVFTDFDKIPALLLGENSSFSGFTAAVRSSALRPNAPVFIPSRTKAFSAAVSSLPKVVEAKNGETISNEAPPTKDNVLDDTFANDVSELFGGIDDEAVMAQDELSEQHIAAVVLLQDLYRKLFRRRRAQSQQAQAINRHYEACKMAVKTINFGNRKSSLIFLGVIPHILVVVHQVLEYISDRKKKILKRLKTVQHEELEECMKQITEMNALWKRMLPFKKDLDPSSSFHKNRQSGQLKEKVLELESAVLSLPPVIVDRVHEDLEVAVFSLDESRRIVKENPELKPELNVEDLDMI